MNGKMMSREDAIKRIKKIIKIGKPHLTCKLADNMGGCGVLCPFGKVDGYCMLRIAFKED